MRSLIVSVCQLLFFVSSGPFLADLGDFLFSQLVFHRSFVTCNFHENVNGLMPKSIKFN